MDFATMTSKSLFTFPSKFSFFYIQRFDAFFSPTLWKQHTLSQPVRGWIAMCDRTTNIRLWTVWPMSLIICNASVVSKSIVISVLSTGKSNMQNKNLFAIRNYYQAIINNQPVTLLHNFQTSFFMCTSETIYKTRSRASLTTITITVCYNYLLAICFLTKLQIISIHWTKLKEDESTLSLTGREQRVKQLILIKLTL